MLPYCDKNVIKTFEDKDGNIKQHGKCWYRTQENQ